MGRNVHRDAPPRVGLLAAFPADELKRIKPELVERYRTTAPHLLIGVPAHAELAPGA